jgi:hypothetical protein
MSWNWFPVSAFTAIIAALCALIHSVVAIGITAQQLIALTRAQIHPKRTKIMQHILVDSNTDLARDLALDCQQSATSTSWIPILKEWCRHFSWQVPTMLLGNSIFLG